MRGPKHGGANEFSFEVQNRYSTPDEAEADIRRRLDMKQVIIGFGHPVYTIADPRNKVIKDVARRLSAEAGDTRMFDIGERLERVMWEAKKMFAHFGKKLLGAIPDHGLHVEALAVTSFV